MRPSRFESWPNEAIERVQELERQLRQVDEALFPGGWGAEDEEHHRRRLAQLPVRDAAHGDLVESLAAIEHEQWSVWTKHMLSVLGEVIGLGFYEARYMATKPEGIRKAREALARWRRQIGTPYAQLSEAEKDADREWAIKVLAQIAK